MFSNLKRKIIGPFLLIIGIGAFAGGVAERIEAGKLEAEGNKASASVLEHRIKSGRRGSKAYKINVEYRPEGGSATIAREFDVSKELFEATGDGDKVDVVYLASDPTVVQLVGAEKTGGPAFLIGVVALLAGGVITYVNLRNPKAAPANRPTTA